MINFFKKIFNMNLITINGVKHEVSGRNIKVVGSKILVDGKVIAEDLTGTVDVKFEGDIANLDCTTVTVNGNINGNVDCTEITVSGNIKGYVDGTSIKCGDIDGDVDGTTVTCGNISGKVDAVTVNKK